jgi:serine-type D-Ala-D-Ala carboxypeptidase/endopeptidase (penicillin-binding protein 4)
LPPTVGSAPGTGRRLRRAALVALLAAPILGPAVGRAAEPASVRLLGDAVVRAGRCARYTVEVSPPKPGTEVLLQRRRAGRWVTIARRSLGGDSIATFRVCYGWDDLGTVRLRARWPQQDQANLAGSSRPREVRVVRALWMRRIDRVTSGLAVGVSVREEGRPLYRRADRRRRVPASNEKLLLAMALLDELGSGEGLRTVAAARGIADGVVGNLWILGRGDPGMGPARMARLGRAIEEGGIRRVRGSVIGSTSFFARDWRAPGWKPYFPRTEVPLPTALVWKGNRAGGRHVRDPERRAARGLTRVLERRGIPVGGRPEMGPAPGGLANVASVRSPVVERLLETMARHSQNFTAEVLGKRLGVERGGPPGTIAKGAAAIEAWASRRGVAVRAHDGSGLSYRNRVSPLGLVRLLGAAERERWAPLLLDILPAGGEGTLGSRLEGVPVRAKTGTLTRISALSGFVWLKRSGTWAEFSILSRGLSKDRAVAIENTVVRLAWRNAAAM